MLDKPKRKRRKNLSAKDAAHIKKLIAENPECTCASIAHMIGWDRGCLGRFAKRYDIKFPRQHIQQPIHATGITGDLMRLVETKEISQTRIAKELQVVNSTITRWRLGYSEPNLFLAECMANMAGYKLALVPLSDLSSQDDRH